MKKTWKKTAVVLTAAAAAFALYGCSGSGSADTANKGSESAGAEKQPDVVVAVSEEGSRSDSVTARDGESRPTSDDVQKLGSVEQPETTTNAEQQSDILPGKQKETRLPSRVSFRHQATQADLIDSKQSKCCILI